MALSKIRGSPRGRLTRGRGNKHSPSSFLRLNFGTMLAIALAVCFVYNLLTYNSYYNDGQLGLSLSSEKDDIWKTEKGVRGPLKVHKDVDQRRAEDRDENENPGDDMENDQSEENDEIDSEKEDIENNHQEDEKVEEEIEEDAQEENLPNDEETDDGNEDGEGEVEGVNEEAGDDGGKIVDAEEDAEEDKNDIEESGDKKDENEDAEENNNGAEDENEDKEEDDGNAEDENEDKEEDGDAEDENEDEEEGEGDAKDENEDKENDGDGDGDAKDEDEDEEEGDGDAKDENEDDENDGNGGAKDENKDEEEDDRDAKDENEDKEEDGDAKDENEDEEENDGDAKDTNEDEEKNEDSVKDENDNIAEIDAEAEREEKDGDDNAGGVTEDVIDIQENDEEVGVAQANDGNAENAKKGIIEVSDVSETGNGKGNAKDELDLDQVEQADKKAKDEPIEIVENADGTQDGAIEEAKDEPIDGEKVVEVKNDRVDAEQNADHNVEGDGIEKSTENKQADGIVSGQFREESEEQKTGAANKNLAPVIAMKKDTIPDAIAVIGFAITVTDCSEDGVFLDNAAVVHHSVYLSSIRNNETGTPPSKYDFKMYAFVHPDAASCSRGLSKLGYEVQEKPMPVEVKDMDNTELQQATNNGCCGAKEFMKLYSYLLPHPVVVHLDVDCLVLKPMDALFDAMMLPGYTVKSGDPDPVKDSLGVMWSNEYYAPTETGSKMYRQPIDFFFTRDYNMVDPPRRQPDQIGVQGGFLVVRPNATDFDQYIKIIRSGGNFNIGAGWGGSKMAYGGYYGAATVQGLASYYHGKKFSPENNRRAVELNRCYYNSMVDQPFGKRAFAKKEDDVMCRTLQEDDLCEDCRETDISKIHTAHFTLCQKPHLCPEYMWTQGYSQDAKKISSHAKPGLCLHFHNEWHRVRHSLEQKWVAKFSSTDKSSGVYEPSVRESVGSWKDTSSHKSHSWGGVINRLLHNSKVDNFLQTHCSLDGGDHSYARMSFPSSVLDDESTNAVL